MTSTCKEHNPDELATAVKQQRAHPGCDVPRDLPGGSIDLIAGYANVNSSSTSPFNIGGRSEISVGRYNVGLPRFAGSEQKLSFGFDWRTYDNNVTPVGTSTEAVCANFSVVWVC